MTLLDLQKVILAYIEDTFPGAWPERVRIDLRGYDAPLSFPVATNSRMREPPESWPWGLPAQPTPAGPAAPQTTEHAANAAPATASSAEASRFACAADILQ